MTIFLDLVVSGLISGALYSMIAVSLVMTYTTTGIYNFSQGAVAFLCAYSFMELHVAAGLPTLISALISLFVIAPLMGLGMELWVFRRLARAPELARIVGSVGLAIAIPAFVLLALSGFGAISGIGSHIVEPAVANPIALGPTPEIIWSPGAGLVVNSNEVIVLGLALLLAFVYWFILRRTRIGLEMRATVDGHQLAAIRGVSQKHVSRWAWVLSFVSAGLVGVCGSIILGLDPNDYLSLLFVSSAAAVIGGFRSVPWAFAGGLILGVLQNIVFGYVAKGPLASVAGLSSAVPFVVLLVGLFVMSRRRSGVARTAAAMNDAVLELTRPRRTTFEKIRLTLIISALVAFSYFVISGSWNEFVAAGICYAIVFMSFVLTTGLGGLVSLAQAGFVTCGGLLAGWLASAYGWPLWAAAVVAVLVALAAGVIVAIPAVKLGGLQLAVASLALAFIFDDLIFEVPSINNDGTAWFVGRPQVPGLSFGSNRNFMLLLAAILVVFYVMVRNFELSHIGRSVLASRGSRAGATMSGISIVRARMLVFAFSAVIAGVGGFFLAQVYAGVSSSENPPLNALLWVTIAITLGVRRPVGAIFAGLSAALIPELLSYITTNTNWPSLLFGLGAVGLARYPEGAMRLQRRQLDWIVAHLVTGVRRLLATSSTREIPEIAAQSFGNAELALNSANVISNGDFSEDSPPMNVGVRPPLVRGAEGEPVVTGIGGSIGGRALLVVKDLRAGYGDLEVLHSVNLSVLAGCVTAVFGANGAGKSTLCSVLASSVVPTAGEIYLDGERAEGLSAVHRLEKGLFIVTESRSIFPNLSVEDNLMIALRTRDAVAEALEQMPELQLRRRLNAGLLSGGEQQLLALAPAFVLSPKIVVADEPTLGLAPRARERIMAVVRLLQERGTALLLIEERPAEVFDIADEVALLRLGVIEWQRAKDDVPVEMLVESYLAAKSQVVDSY